LLSGAQYRFWQPPSSGGSAYADITVPEVRTQLAELDRQRDRLVREVLGVDFQSELLKYWGGDAERTGCGLILTSRSLGVTHPVLPCGARILIRYGGETVLTEVIDNQLKETGRQFELTPSLARLVGLDGTQAVEWRYATR